MQDTFDREKVVQFFKLAFTDCRQIEGKSMKLMPPHADSVYSKGYQIHISPNDNKIFESCIERIAKENELATANEGNTLIVFNPSK